MSDDLRKILARPTQIKTYPPAGERGIWRATLRLALGHLDAPVRPYFYIGSGTTEQEAIDDLMKAEAADTWKPPVCRHEFQCDGWTVDPQTSTCRVCHRIFVFWSNPQHTMTFAAPVDARSSNL